MRLTRMRVGRAHNFAKQKKRRITQLVLLQDGIEGNILTVVSQVAIWNVINGSIFDRRPVGVMWQKNKFRVGIDELSDQPRTSHPVHFDFLACDPLHAGRRYSEISVAQAIGSIAFLGAFYVEPWPFARYFGLMAAWFWYAVVAAVLYGAHQIFTRL